LSVFVLRVEVFEVWDAPAAPGACSEAFRDQRRDLWVFASKVAIDLDERDMEAQADIIGWFHADRSV
tara:strand:+ start:141 stop:341 length:201 start_codon:yes stop_codon:yes gene_type:complete